MEKMEKAGNWGRRMEVPGGKGGGLLKDDAKTCSRWWQLKYFWNFHPGSLGK